MAADSLLALLLLTRVEICAEQGRCNVTLLSSEVNCQCDDRCGLYHECCQDINSSLPTIPLEILVCQQHPRYYTSFNVSAGVMYSVNKCPAGYNDNETRALCEENGGDDLLLEVPVNGRRTGVLYKNIFCAVCGGIDSVEDASDVVFWTVRKECLGLRNPSAEIEELFNDTASEPCSVRHSYFSPSETALGGQPAIRKCVKQTSHCPNDWDLGPGSNVTAEMCPGMMNIVYASKRIFRNQFCAFCHGIIDISFTIPSFPTIRPLVLIPPYSVLLDLNTGQMSMYHPNHQVARSRAIPKLPCDSGEVHDILSGNCRPLYKTTGSTERMRSSEYQQHTSNHSYVMVLHNRSDFHIIRDGNPSVKSFHTVDKNGSIESSKNNQSVCTNENISRGQNTTDEVISKDPVEIVKGYLTLVGLVLSLISLAACIVAHSIFQELRNIPGKCVLGLSCSLFVAQLLFLTTITRSESPGCYAFALLIQYSFLATFCWTNCLNFDMCRAFSGSHSSDGEHKGCYIRYSCYAWLTPLVAVATGVLLNHMDAVNDELRPHYGDPLCWINRGKALLVVFVVPMAMNLFANIIMFVLITRSIYMSMRVGHRVTSRGESTRALELLLYIKLSVIMGLTWLFGLLAASSKLHALWYLFIIFNSLQGLLLFLCFVCTKRVRKLVRDKRSSLFRLSKWRSNSTSSAGIYAAHGLTVYTSERF